MIAYNYESTQHCPVCGDRYQRVGLPDHMDPRFHVEYHLCDVCMRDAGVRIRIEMLENCYRRNKTPLLFRLLFLSRIERLIYRYVWGNKDTARGNRIKNNRDLFAGRIQYA